MGGSPHLQSDEGRRKALAAIAAVELAWAQQEISSGGAMHRIAEILKTGQ